MPPYRFMVLVALTVSLLNSTQLPVLGQGQDVIEGETIPAEVVLRLLSSDFLEVQQILLNQLPDNLPVQLPLPDQANVLASVIYQIEGFDSEAYRVLLDAPQAPEIVTDQYRQQLESLSWEMLSPTRGEHGGFIASTTEPKIQLTFCNEDKAQQIFVTASSQEDNSTALDLNLSPVTENSSICRAELTSSESPNFWVPMPLLNPPPGAIVNPQGRSASGSSPNEYFFVEVTAEIEAELSADAIAQHYATQWEAEGWTLQSEETNDSVKKVWILEDEAGQLWEGTLTIDSTEEAGSYSAISTVQTLQTLQEN